MKRSTTFFCIIATAAAISCGGRSHVPDDAPQIPRQPRITPDYSDVVLPPNIAPLNFAINENGDAFAVRISGESGHSILVSAKHHDVQIPEKAWKALLGQNRGRKLSTALFVLRQDRWHQFKPLENKVAEEELDPFVVYRWMRSLHHYMERLFLVERSIESFQERTVLDSKSIGGSCMNCHTFLNGKTDTMTYQIRSKKFGLPMMLVKNDRATPVNTLTAGFSKSPAAFTSWHPSGKLIAFSVNKVSPYEHTLGSTRGEWDDDSDLAIYHVDENKVSSTAALSNPERRESWPAWSGDGKHLYYSSAPQLPFAEFRKVQYDLMRLPFDPATGEWGKAEVLVSSKDVNMSCVEPRSSPDGKWVLFCGAEYGHMACFVKSSDLYILNTETGEHRKLGINSDLSESWPSWSSNGRWIVFASKRRDELFGHIYFSYFDKDGKAHKPFILPQKDPRFYDSSAMTYNRPELAVEPVKLTGSALAKSICKPDQTLEPPKAFDRAGGKTPSPAPGHDEWGPVTGRTQGSH